MHVGVRLEVKDKNGVCELRRRRWRSAAATMENGNDTGRTPINEKIHNTNENSKI